MRAWNRQKYTLKTCAFCYSPFQATRTDALYCSALCLSRSRPKRQPYSPEYHRARRQIRLSRPGYRDMINRQANARAIRVRRWLDAYKLAIGCVDCGYKVHHAALHFDHVRGQKLINVCNAKSIAQAEAEIEKCEVRCANCHAVKTWTLYPCKPGIFEATYEPVSEEQGGSSQI